MIHHHHHHKWSLAAKLQPLTATTSTPLFVVNFSFKPAAAAGVMSKCLAGKKEDTVLEGMPKEYYDDEWQKQQREKAKELERLRQQEDEEEERKIDEYREVGTRLKGYPEEDVSKAKKLISSFIRAADEIEQKIEEAAEKGELNELVLMVIWNRLDLARRDEERDVIRSLDLLYRRVETEILKREASPAMRLLNELLNMNTGSNHQDWLKSCKKLMIDTFPREDPFSILVPEGFDINEHEGPIPMPEDDGDILLRVDFIREVDELLQQVKAGKNEEQKGKQGFDAEAIANKLKQQEKQRTIRKVEALLELAVNLKW
ncbi:Protein PALE CRESS, chloroplastic [Linum perenne]